MIETDRLILRLWRKADHEPYVAMMTDPDVGYWLGGPFERDAALAQLARFDAQTRADGRDFLSLERMSDGAFLGAAGLRALKRDHPLAPGVEIGWRLTRSAWGHGYAQEAARALLHDGFGRQGLAAILAFTATSNLRSQAVMTSLGMKRDPVRDFDHPALAADHPLRRHVVYAAGAL